MQIITAALPVPVLAVLYDEMCVVNTAHGTARSFVIVAADMLCAAAVTMSAVLGAERGVG